MTQPRIYVIIIETVIVKDVFDIFNIKECVIIYGFLILKEQVKKCSQLLIQREGKKKTKSMFLRATQIGCKFEPTPSNI